MPSKGRLHLFAWGPFRQGRFLFLLSSGTALFDFLDLACSPFFRLPRPLAAFSYCLPLTFDDICIFGILHILSINHKFSDIWFSGKYEILRYEGQPQYVVLSALIKKPLTGPYSSYYAYHSVVFFIYWPLTS